MHLLAGARHFRVVEIPAYEPCGEGEHLYLEIEKEGLTTDQAARLLAEAAGLPARAVGWAGRKDRHAVTRQWLSLHGTGVEAPQDVRVPPGGRLEVLRADRHRNKLRPGHLRGNRFELDVALPTPGLEVALGELERLGIPNRFGRQRFGLDGANLVTARAWGRGERPTGDRRYRRLVASAAQSAIFNAVLDARERAGLLRRLRVGDVAQVPGGGRFVCSPGDLEDANERAARLELLATGPLPGSARLRPAPEVEAEERTWSAGCGIEWSWLERGGPLESAGDRRPLLVAFLEAPRVERSEGLAHLRFALPAGSYATVVLARLGVEVPGDRRGEA